ncbi:MAG: hypothetical protein K5695_05870 [Oscillospiraceae bacterium]|nr:hypothetical protein [Oscillospiraceae bacterium]
MKRITSLIAIVLLCTMLTGCMSKEAKSTQEAIDALPETYDTSVNGALSDAHKAYDALSDQEKKKIDITKMTQLDNLKSDYEAEVKAEQERKKAEREKIKAEAEKVNKEIRALNLSARTITDLKNSADNYNNVIKAIKNSPIEAEEYIEYDVFQKKMDNMLAEIQKLSDQLEKDQNTWSEVTILNNTYADTLGYAMDAYGNLDTNELDRQAHTAIDSIQQMYDDLYSIKSFDVEKSKQAVSELRKTANTGGKYKDWLHNMIQKSSDFSISLITDDSHKREAVSDYGDALKVWQNALEDSDEVLVPRGHNSVKQ